MSQLHWLKSSFSETGGNNCVEVTAISGTHIAIREGDSPTRLLTADRATLRALLTGVKAGRFADLSDAPH